MIPKGFNNTHITDIEAMYANIESISQYFRCYEDYQKENGFAEFKLRHNIVD